MLFSEEDLGVETPLPVVEDIKHSHYGLSWVFLNYAGKRTYVVLNTEELDIEYADQACAAVPEWWDPSINKFFVYAALQD